MENEDIAVCAAGRMGVGPGVKRRFLRSIPIKSLRSQKCRSQVVYRNLAVLTCDAAHGCEHAQGRFRNQARTDFDARISGFATSGGLAKRSAALAKSALAISPFRCALRPFSSANVSKMPYFPGPILMAYQLIVSGSRSASGCADFKNASTSFSLPGLASSCAQMANLLMSWPPAHKMRQERIRNKH